MRALNAKSKKQLRKLGHSLNPVVQIGGQGLKDTVIDATKEALLAHELIKVKASVENKHESKQLFATLIEKTDSLMVAEIGFTALLYKQHPKKPKIELHS